jgi:hypothetical protein
MLTKERKQKGTKMLVLQLGLIPLNDYFLDLFIGTLTPCVCHDELFALNK